MGSNPEVKSFTFFASYYMASKFMSDDERSEFFMVILEYAFEDRAPDYESVSPAVMMAFTLVRPNIDNSLKNARNGAKGGSAKKSDDRSRGADKPTRKPAYKPANKPASDDSSSDKDRKMDKDMDKERDKEAGVDKRGSEPREGPPSLESVAAFVKEEGLVINAEAFYGYYAARGWMLGGTPVADWKALAHAWQAREAKFGCAKKGEASVDEGIYSVFEQPGA